MWRLVILHIDGDGFLLGLEIGGRLYGCGMLSESFFDEGEAFHALGLLVVHDINNFVGLEFCLMTTYFRVGVFTPIKEELI